METLHFHLILGLLVFFIGVSGFLLRRNALVVLMSLELMLNGVNIVLVTFSKHHAHPAGNVLMLLIVLVAAAEAALAFALLVWLYRHYGSTALERFRSLRG